MGLISNCSWRRRRRCCCCYTTQMTTITSLLLVVVLFLTLTTTSVIANRNKKNHDESTIDHLSKHKQVDEIEEKGAPWVSYYNDKKQKQQEQQQQQQQDERELNDRSKSRYYYEFLNDDVQATLPPSTISDVLLCLACALGWMLWLVNLRQAQQPIVFEQRESRTVMGHVLQVSLGEDNLGTGIPVYHAIVDYVVDATTTTTTTTTDDDVEPLQIRKRFTSKKLLEEGFANVQILILCDDPTTAILLDEFYELKKERETQIPPSKAYTFLIHFVAFILIGGSFFGGILVTLRLEERLYGWSLLAGGIVLLYPAAILLYRLISSLYSLAGPLTDRPGVIMNGKRFYCGTKCGAAEAIDAIFDGDDDDGNNNSFNINVTKPSRTQHPGGALELSQLQIPSIDQQSRSNNNGDVVATPKRLLYPNAGCGFGNFNVLLPKGRNRAISNVSSISASESNNSNTTSVSKGGTQKKQ